MERIKIKGHSSWIKGGTNTGVFLFKDQSALIVDPGHSPSRGRRLYHYLKESGTPVRHVYFTHEHGDHTVACKGMLEEAPLLNLYCHDKARPLIEHAYLIQMGSYGAYPPPYLAKHRAEEDFLQITETASEGAFTIHDKEFSVLYTPGHTIGCSALKTEDGVAFTGDTVFSERIMEKYGIPFLYHIAHQKESLQRLLEWDLEYAVLAHAEEIYDTESFRALLHKNIAHLDYYIEMCMSLLETPITRETLLDDLLTLDGMTVEPKTYHYNYTSIGAILTYLLDEKRIAYTCEDNKIYYYAIK